MAHAQQKMGSIHFTPTLTPPPDFISPTVASLTVNHGGQNSVTLTFAVRGGYQPGPQPLLQGANCLSPNDLESRRIRLRAEKLHDPIWPCEGILRESVGLNATFGGLDKLKARPEPTLTRYDIYINRKTN
jgi:hypothetical protein